MAALTDADAAVLGLLTFGPQSGYELTKHAQRTLAFFGETARSHISAVLPTLEERGLAERETVRQASRPDKHVYRLTEAGEDALREWLEALADEPETPARNTFQLRVFFGAQMRPESVERLVRGRRAAAQEHIERLREIERDARKTDDPADFFPLLTLELGVARSRTFVEWCDHALAAIEKRRRR